MKYPRLLAMLTAPILFLSGCAGVSPEMYAAEKPTLDLYEYFNGRVDAWGYFADRSGRVVRRFTVAIDGTTQGDALVLDENFTYSDGTTSRRVWTIRRSDAHTYTGTAGDVIGTAQGRAFGNALQWGYRLALEVDGRTYNVTFDDWMYLQDSRVMLNHSIMSKFGFRLGEVVLTFRKA
jgi:hypothetical protein